MVIYLLCGQGRREEIGSKLKRKLGVNLVYLAKTLAHGSVILVQRYRKKFVNLVFNVLIVRWKCL